ncbi:FtsB family cell division protein [Aurantiacibacter spongiae]|uniref:Septum formation initiator family protein n=1 Tax=Aurantiacibacter spongiae TaxID=2488860 RepID=A0A3N5CN15_9SPHN|nr:septum formation initiator family protein [Aurantiacibacter spongiae]RPF70343.1 septum formation initiator family protein [Aurantiacibacter spongiae]
MNTHRKRLVRERIVNAGALSVLLFIGAMAFVGPSGVLAWGENAAKLEQHQARIAALSERRDTLANRVERLDPDNVDPDLADELVRGSLGVAHPDEYVVEMDQLD